MSSDTSVPQSLAAKAQEILARRHGLEKDVVLVGSSAHDLSAKGGRLYQFQVARKSVPNSAPFTVLLDADGAVVSRESLSFEDRKALAARPSYRLRLSPVVEAPAGAITIDPETNDLTLGLGDTLHEILTVTVPKNSTVPKADVYFLADTTGSMSSILSAVQAGAGSMLSALSGLPLDLAFGVGNYKDFPFDSYAFQHQQSSTSIAADAQAAINTWAAGGGADGSEGQLFALDQLAEAPGGSIGWRAGAKRILVWFGDAPGHDPICGAISGLGRDIDEASVTDKLKDEDIIVLAISTTTSFALGLDDDPTSQAGDYSGTCTIGGTAGQASRIATATGGSHTVGIDPSEIVNTIVALVTAAATQINHLELVAAGATAPFVASISPAAGYGPLAGDVEHSLKFEVDFRGVVGCSEKEDQEFFGTLDVVADGVVVTQKRVRIVVPRCVAKRPYRYAVKFVCGTQEECPCHDGPVRPGIYATEINILNPSEREAQVDKHILSLVFAGVPAGREPRQVGRRASDFILLAPHSATMDDGVRIAELLYGGAPSSPNALNVGFVEILSSAPLSVVAVYTATGLGGGPVSLEVEHVPALQL